MNKKQKRTLKLLRKKGLMTSEELCKKLKIDLGNSMTYYSALMFRLPYLSDDEFDDMVVLNSFSLEEDALNERATFQLSSRGEKYFAAKKNVKKSKKFNIAILLIAFFSLLVGAFSLVITLIK